MPLPVGVGTAAVQAEDEGNRLALLQVARVVEKVRAPALHLDDRAGMRDGGGAAGIHAVRAAQLERVRARRAGELQRVLLRRGAPRGKPERGGGCHQRYETKKSP